MKKVYLLSLFILAILIGGCSSINNTDQPQVTQAATTDVIPTQDSTKGTVTGKIITSSSDERIGLIIYLGDVIVDPKGNTGGFLDKTRAPSTLLDSDNGVFTISNVPPGQYSLIIYEVVAGGRVYTDDKGNVAIIKVEPGKTVDLGDIDFPGF